MYATYQEALFCTGTIFEMDFEAFSKALDSGKLPALDSNSLTLESLLESGFQLSVAVAVDGDVFC